MVVHFVFGKMWVQVFIFSLHATSFFAIQKEPVSGTWPKHIDDEVFSSRKRCIGFLELGTKASVFSSITSSRQASLMYCKRQRVIYHYTLFEESGGGSLWRYHLHCLLNKNLTFNRFSRLFKSYQTIINYQRWLFLFWMKIAAFALGKPAQESPTPFVFTTTS